MGWWSRAGAVTILLQLLLFSMEVVT